MPYLYELMLLFPFVFCRFRVAYKTDVGLLQTEDLTNSDQWKAIHAAIETCIFDRTCMFCPHIWPGDKVPYPCCQG